MSDFVFATAQYDSGDWDSAPLLPANVIDSVARYTAIDVAPTGVIVPLSAPALFRYPLVYSSKDYSSEWNYHPDNKRFLSVDNTKFAVNLVVYALTR